MDEGRDQDFVRFVEARGASLTRLAFVLSGGDEHLALDLVQDTLLKAYRRWDRVSAAGSLNAYVRRMLVNEFLSWRRRTSSRESPVPAVPDAPVVDVLPEGTSTELWSLICEMSPRRRAVLVLRYYEDLSDREIADLLDYRVGSVKVIAGRALNELRRRIGQESGGSRR
jgi:RNA polymerase sigma-70 factor (sigma-E family)